MLNAGAHGHKFPKYEIISPSQNGGKESCDTKIGENWPRTVWKAKCLYTDGAKKMIFHLQPADTGWQD